MYFLTRRQNLVLKKSPIGGRILGVCILRRIIGKVAFFFGVFTSRSEAAGRTEGRRLSPKTSPKGEFEGLEAASTKCEWLGVRITFRM